MTEPTFKTSRIDPNALRSATSGHVISARDISDPVALTFGGRQLCTFNRDGTIEFSTEFEPTVAASEASSAFLDWAAEFNGALRRARDAQRATPGLEAVGRYEAPSAEDREAEERDAEILAESRMAGDWLPAWAERKADGFELRAALATRDGRGCGNAAITGFSVRHGQRVARVVTDAGHGMWMTPAEIEERFFPPCYVMRDLLPAHIEDDGAAPTDDRINLDDYRRGGGE